MKNKKMSLQAKNRILLAIILVITLAWTVCIIFRSRFNGTFCLRIDMECMIYIVVVLFMLDGFVLHAVLGLVTCIFAMVCSPKGQSRKEFASSNDFDFVLEKLSWFAFPINILFAVIHMSGIADIVSPFF